jgi:hypothetical protein
MRSWFSASTPLVLKLTPPIGTSKLAFYGARFMGYR